MDKKILIVEDEKMLREMYEEKFSQAGYKVSSAETTKEGVKKAKEEKPDLILLDILLPKEGGLVFLRRQKEDPEIKDITVVAFSNYDGKGTKEQALQLGVEDYLIKTDYTPSQIAEKIKEYL